MSREEEYIIRPIGYVRVEGEDLMKAAFYLDIQEQFRSGLKQLDKFSHVMVFWWAHENDTPEIRNQENWSMIPPYGENTPETGLFASRGEYRPNPIALTTVPIMEVDEKKGIVKVAGMDAFNGTPVIDLKAYFPICDRIRDCHIAPWLKDWPEWQEDGLEWWAEQGFFDDFEG
ncbi:MAG: TrmO family methyltransferase [Promethearchaeota archaeon]